MKYGNVASYRFFAKNPEIVTSKLGNLSDHDSGYLPTHGFFSDRQCYTQVARKIVESLELIKK